MVGATLFSGIGAPETAMPHWRWAWSAEIEKFPSAVHAVRHPQSVNLGDVTANGFTERAQDIARPDVIVFGSPCQSFSIAGKRLGMDDPRGNLAIVALGIVARLEPRWFAFHKGGDGSELAKAMGTSRAWRRYVEPRGQAMTNLSESSWRPTAMCNDCNKWLDIETAPKDGTPVDLWRPQKAARPARRIENARWDEKRELWNCGYYDSNSLFTHWRPLPEPPDALAQQPADHGREVAARYESALRNNLAKPAGKEG